MNIFLDSPRNRLKNWQTFRDSLKNYDEMTQMEMVAKYWSQAPLQKFCYEIEEPNTWPTPWETINNNDYCRSFIAACMEFTLRLSGWDNKRLRLAMMKDTELSDMFMILIIDEKHLLNYTFNSVDLLENKSFDILFSYQFDDKKYIEI